MHGIIKIDMSSLCVTLNQCGVIVSDKMEPIDHMQFKTHGNQ